MKKVKKDIGMDTPTEDPRFMTSLARGLEVLSLFEGQTALTVTQAAKGTSLSRSSVARCLFTLEQLGYVAADGPAYRLRPALLPLLRAYALSDPLARNGQPIVEAVRNNLNESCSLAMFDTRHPHDTVIYICRAETSRIISAPLLIGSTLPSYCTSIGRVLLAALPPEQIADYLALAPFPVRTPKTLTQAEELAAELTQVQQQNWALADGELEAGLRSIAVPIRHSNGRVIAAINLATQATHRSLTWLTETALPELQAAAAHLARVA
jgi:IclR family transcriptional regulator, pca regulon regulatory protein